MFKATDDRERPVIIKTWTLHSLSKPNRCMLDRNEMSFNISMEEYVLYVLGASISLFIEMVKVQAYIALCMRIIKILTNG